MRIDSINLSWFRGAADPVALDCGLKSLVVYGQNGAGKSAFVDAVEYAVSGGKIAHLAHEYSGTKQEEAVPNTHTPQECGSSFSVKFKHGAEAAVRSLGTERTQGPEPSIRRRGITAEPCFGRTKSRDSSTAARAQNTPTCSRCWALVISKSPPTTCANSPGQLSSNPD
ncbi:MAG: hypothetical protein V3V97_20140 [Hyphomicrobiaceae bacterium]